MESNEREDNRTLLRQWISVTTSQGYHVVDIPVWGAVCLRTAYDPHGPINPSQNRPLHNLNT